jgi:hypothetical protein
VGGQQELGAESFQPRDRLSKAVQVVVPGRDQLATGAVVDAVGEDGVDDDRRSGSLFPKAQVPRRVAGQMQDFEPPVRVETDGLAAAEPEVDRRIAAHRREQLGGVHRREAVRGVPSVVLPDERLVRLDPAPVELVAQEDRVGVSVAEGVVPSNVVVVGVADQDEGRFHPRTLQVRVDYRRRCVRQPGVDEERSLAAGDDVLAHEARPEVALDAVEAVGDLSHSDKEG